MKCLTVKPPMAGALVAGVKDCENRTWRTRAQSPGRVLIHNSRSPMLMTGQDLARFDFLVRDYRPLIEQFEPGAIIGAVTFARSERPADVDSPWATGPWCWMVEPDSALVFVEPIQLARGRRGLFEVDDALVADAITAAQSPRDALDRHWRKRRADDDPQDAMTCPHCGGLDAHTPTCPRR